MDGVQSSDTAYCSAALMQGSGQAQEPAVRTK